MPASGGRRDKANFRLWLASGKSYVQNYVEYPKPQPSVSKQEETQEIKEEEQVKVDRKYLNKYLVDELFSSESPQFFTLNWAIGKHPLAVL